MSPHQPFQLSFVSGDSELPAPPASEILARVRDRPQWDEASLTRGEDQFPRMHIARCEDYGFILHCFDDIESWGDFLATDLTFSAPTIEINLAGQALERWPLELFVSEQIAEDALSFFLKFGKRDSSQQWTKGDGFPREIIWEGWEQREAWESAHKGV